MPIQVRVKDLKDGFFGYYGDQRRKVGSVFFIKDETEFSKRWMEKVSEHPAPSAKSKQITGDPKTRQPAAKRAAHSRAETVLPPQGGNAIGSDSAPAGNAGDEGEVI